MKKKLLRPTIVLLSVSWWLMGITPTQAMQSDQTDTDLTCNFTKIAVRTLGHNYQLGYDFNAKAAQAQCKECKTVFKLAAYNPINSTDIDKMASHMVTNHEEILMDEYMTEQMNGHECRTGDIQIAAVRLREALQNRK